MLAFIPPSSSHITPSLFTEKKQRLREVTAPCRLPDESKNHICDWDSAFEAQWNRRLHRPRGSLLRKGWGPCQASGSTTRGMLTGEGWGPVLDDGGHQLAYPLHPSAQVLLIHVSQVGGVSSCDGVMVLDLGPPPEPEGVGSGPAPLQHLLSWHPLGTFAAGVNGEGGGSSHFTEEETEVREADGLAQLLFTLI